MFIQEVARVAKTGKFAVISRGILVHAREQIRLCLGGLSAWVSRCLCDVSQQGAETLRHLVTLSQSIGIRAAIALGVCIAPFVGTLFSLIV